MNQDHRKLWFRSSFSSWHMKRNIKCWILWNHTVMMKKIILKDFLLSYNPIVPKIWESYLYPINHVTRCYGKVSWVDLSQHATPLTVTSLKPYYEEGILIMQFTPLKRNIQKWLHQLEGSSFKIVGKMIKIRLSKTTSLEELNLHKSIMREWRCVGCFDNRQQMSDVWAHTNVILIQKICSLMLNI